MSAYREPAPKPPVPKKPFPWQMFYMPVIRVLKIILFIPLKILQFVVYILNEFIWKLFFGRLMGYIFYGDSTHGAIDRNIGQPLRTCPRAPQDAQTNSFYRIEKRHGKDLPVEDWWILFERTSIFDRIPWPDDTFFEEKKPVAESTKQSE
jgi:hypothetical protein